MYVLKININNIPYKFKIDNKDSVEIFADDKKILDLSINTSKANNQVFFLPEDGLSSKVNKYQTIQKGAKKCLLFP